MKFLMYAIADSILGINLSPDPILQLAKKNLIYKCKFKIIHNLLAISKPICIVLNESYHVSYMYSFFIENILKKQFSNIWRSWKERVQEHFIKKNKIKMAMCSTNVRRKFLYYCITLLFQIK